MVFWLFKLGFIFRNKVKLNVWLILNFLMSVMVVEWIFFEIDNFGEK